MEAEFNECPDCGLALGPSGENTHSEIVSDSALGEFSPEWVCLKCGKSWSVQYDACPDCGPQDPKEPPAPSLVFWLELRDWFVQGWRTYNDHPGVLIGGGILFWLVGRIISAIPYCGWLWWFGIEPPLYGGYFVLCVRLIREERAKFSSIFNGFAHFGSVWISAILWQLMVFFGLILLILPGIFLGVKYCFAPFAALDRSLGPIEALKFSGKVTKRFIGLLTTAAAFGIVAYLVTLQPVWSTMLRAIVPGLGTSFPGRWVLGLFSNLLNILFITPALTATEAAAYVRLVAQKGESVRADDVNPA